MNKTCEIFIKGIILSLVPAGLTLLGTIDTLNVLQAKGYIGAAINIQNVKDTCSILGVVMTFLLLTRNVIKHEVEENKYRCQSRQLIKYNKDILINALAEYLGKEYCNIDIRIFVPKKTWIWRIGHIFYKKMPLKFCIKNIEGLAEAGVTNNLKFQVEPPSKVQGLVGECYQQRKIVYDDNLETTNSTGYNLTDYQKSKTNHLKFILVCPVFKETEIEAVVAFDCKHEIKIQEQEDKFIKAVLNYTQQLHEYVPELFKCKGGII